MSSLVGRGISIERLMCIIEHCICPNLLSVLKTQANSVDEGARCVSMVPYSQKQIY